MATDITIEEKDKIHQLCKSYLGKQWFQVKTSELTIKHITDGFVNKLYLCSLPDDIQSANKQVVVRYVDYENFKKYYDQTHLIAMNVILSQLNISPKLLGVIPNGTINEYINCRYFNNEDDLKPEFVSLLAQKLAKFHSLNDIPVPKQSKLMVDMFEDFFDETLQKSYTSGSVRQQISDMGLKTLQELDLLVENKWLSKTIRGIQSPIVFSHNDFNRRNTLVTNKITENNNKDLEIYLIDFDWTNYNYRGVDFGQYFSSWGQIETDFGGGDFPGDQQMRPFIDSYLAEMTKIEGKSYGQQDINSRETIIKEAKVFALMAYIKDIMYCIWQTNMSGVTDLMSKAETRFNCYRKLKERILQEYPELN